MLPFTMVRIFLVKCIRSNLLEISKKRTLMFTEIQQTTLMKEILFSYIKRTLWEKERQFIYTKIKAILACTEAEYIALGELKKRTLDF